MESIRSDMEGGIKALLAQQAKEPGTCLVTLAQFDDHYQLLFQGMPISEFTGYQLVPRGSTALLDGIGRTILEVQASLDKVSEAQRPAHVIFAVVTDGFENASREWTREKVMASVKAQMDAGWHFTFLGANQDAIQEGGTLGVRAASAMTFASSARGVEGALTGVSAAISRVRRGADRSLTFTEEERRKSN